MAKIDTQKIIAPIMKFVNMRGIIALKDGMLAILPLTVVGSIFLIVGQLPFEGLNQAIAGIFGKNWTEPFMQVYSGTFAIMGLISCFSIGYSYAKNSGVEPLPAGVLSVSSFFILMYRQKVNLLQMLSLKFGLVVRGLLELLLLVWLSVVSIPCLFKNILLLRCQSKFLKRSPSNLRL